MIEHFLFYGFAILCMVYGIITIVIKIILKRNGFYVTLLNTDFSDFKNLRSLVKKEKKYMIYYYVFILMTIVPLLFVILLVCIVLRR